MKRFTHNESFNFVSQKDTVKFMSMLVSDSNFKNADIHIINSSEIEDEKNILMTNVNINFNVFKGKGKNQIVSKWQWTSFRAKDFCCSGSSFKRLP